MYRVIVKFLDLQDNYTYNVGETYPRKGAKPSEDRIKTLSSSNNVLGKPIIVKIEEKVEEPKKVEPINEEIKVEEPKEEKVAKPKKKKK